MNLDARDMDDLAVFFARRYPESGRAAERLGAEAQVQLPDGEAPSWRLLVTSAQAQGRLGVLVEVARRERPDDARLAELVSLLSGQTARVPRLLWVAAAVVSLGLGLGLWALGSTADVEPEVAGNTVVEAGSLAEPAPTPLAEVTPPATVSEPAAPPASPPAAAAKNLGLRPPPQDGCRGEPGERLGWYHAGAVSPGRAGEVVVLPGAANVRPDYPRADNGWRMSRSVRCTLQAGEHVRLDAEPVAIPGNSVWVPVYGGSRLGFAD